MTEVNFDTKEIKTICFYPKNESKRYIYQEYKPKKKIFFNLITIAKEIPEGYKDIYDYPVIEIIDEEYLKSQNYTIENKIVFYNPYILINLGDNIEIEKCFTTNENAIEYINHLKKLSNKTFEIINK